ncbi:MAG TPA: DegV family protein [Longimicrobiales bacterium]
MKIGYLDGRRLRRSLVAGCEFVQQRRAELNRINVFPVPDGDTGTNLALTASAIADRLRRSRETSISLVARDAADAAIMGARGNCGMILSHFLLGFSDQVKTKPRLSAGEFGVALDGAVRHVYSSLERPVEGTIVTVMRATAEEARQSRMPDFAELLERLLDRAQDALAHTPDLLPQLRAAGVVDAGAKGFVHILEGIVSFMHGDPFTALQTAPSFDVIDAAAARVEYPRESEKYRFCTEGMVRGTSLPEQAAVQVVLRDHGDSLIVIRGSDVLKVHIHTDLPEQVFAYLRTIGELVTHKAEDMAVQHSAVERSAAAHIQLARRPISIVTDSACDLPDEVVRAHGIHVVPMTLVFGEEALRDRVDIDAATFLKRLRGGEQPTTSQPPPAAFFEYYSRAAEDGENILAIPVSSSLSGTYNSAETAAKRFENTPIQLFDSLGASLLQGFLVLRASELADMGNNIDEIVTELKRIRQQSSIFFTVDVFDNLLRSGRVGRGRAWLAGFLDVKPVMEINQSGSVEPVTRVRGMKNVLPWLVRILNERISKDVKSVRFGIIHVGADQLADEAKAALLREFGTREIIVAPATPVLAAHLGPGAWGLAYQIDD